MSSILSPIKLELTAVQHAWLHELGVDKSFLQRLTVPLVSVGSAAPAVNDEAVSEPPAQRLAMASSPNTPPVSAAVQQAVSAAAPKLAPVTDLQAAINQLRQAAGSRAPDIVSASAVEQVEVIYPEPVVPDTLPALRTAVENCTSCALSQGRANAVFGSGATEQVRWMVVSNAPSDADDKTGAVFEGPAGVLLDAMLSSVGLNRNEHCFLTHLVKCRPVNSQAPDVQEVGRCSAYTLQQIALLEPNCLLLLGADTANQLLGSADDIEVLRGRVHHWQSPMGKSIPVVVTYHPTALLLRPQHKANAWRDLLLVQGLDQQLR